MSDFWHGISQRVIELGMMSSLDMEMKQLVDQVIETGKISICSL